MARRAYDISDNAARLIDSIAITRGISKSAVVEMAVYDLAAAGKLPDIIKTAIENFRKLPKY